MLSSYVDPPRLALVVDVTKQNNTEFGTEIDYYLSTYPVFIVIVFPPSSLFLFDNIGSFNFENIILLLLG